MCNTPNTDPYGNTIRSCYCTPETGRVRTLKEIKEVYEYYLYDERAMSSFEDILQRMIDKETM